MSHSKVSNVLVRKVWQAMMQAARRDSFQNLACWQLVMSCRILHTDEKVLSENNSCCRSQDVAMSVNLLHANALKKKKDITSFCTTRTGTWLFRKHCCSVLSDLQVLRLCMLTQIRQHELSHEFVQFRPELLVQ